jgi:SAM-dependent methyltransferase
MPSSPSPCAVTADISDTHTRSDNARHVWEHRYAEALEGTSNVREKLSNPWLARHIAPPVLPGEARPRALDLGCGAGYDTAWLLAQGFEVTATDLSENALVLARRRSPEARFLQTDFRDLDSVLPISRDLADGWHVIVASLSLHYFNLADTLRVFEAIHARLRADGLFAFRVNAFDESGAPPNAAHSWDLATTGTDALPRQYFSEEKIRAVLEGRFVLRFLEKQTVNRYGAGKSLYEVVVTR